jgi:hypothetical protein
MIVIAGGILLALAALCVLRNLHWVLLGLVILYLIGASQ